MRTHFKDRSKRNRIDLTLVGRYELLEPAIANKDTQKFPEARICEPYTAPSQPLPTFYPETRARWSLWKVIINECANLIKI